jgi:hypothetical protein
MDASAADAAEVPVATLQDHRTTAETVAQRTGRGQAIDAVACHPHTTAEVPTSAVATTMSGIVNKCDHRPSHMAEALLQGHSGTRRLRLAELQVFPATVSILLRRHHRMCKASPSLPCPQ